MKTIAVSPSQVTRMLNILYTLQRATETGKGAVLLRGQFLDEVLALAKAIDRNSKA